MNQIPVIPVTESFSGVADMSSTAFIEPLPVIDFVTQLLNRDVLARTLSDADRVKVCFCSFVWFLMSFYWFLINAE